MTKTVASPGETARTWPDWFTAGYAEAAFTRHLHHLAGRDRLRFLQIGAYAGDASVWLADTILTGPHSMLVDVDTWRGSTDDPGTEAIDFTEVLDYYLARIEGRPNVTSYHGSSDHYFDMLRTTYARTRYDFVYIDGDHHPEQVLRDAVHADRHLKIGGLLAFDDYRWGEGVLRDRPAPAIEAFVRCYERRYELVEADLQVWVRRIA